MRMKGEDLQLREREMEVILASECRTSLRLDDSATEIRRDGDLRTHGRLAHAGASFFSSESSAGVTTAAAGAGVTSGSSTADQVRISPHVQPISEQDVTPTLRFRFSRRGIVDDDWRFYDGGLLNCSQDA